MTLLIFLFAVTMSVNHGKGKNDDETENQHDDHRLIFPDLANKFGRFCIHAKKHTPNLLRMKCYFRFSVGRRHGGNE